MSLSKAESGFTLLEMLITIAVMGLAMLLIAYYAQPHSHRLDAERAAQHVAAMMRAGPGPGHRHRTTGALCAAASAGLAQRHRSTPAGWADLRAGR